MIRFDGPFVTGFIVPRATNEMHAIKQLRVLLWARLKILQDNSSNRGTNSHSNTIRQYLRSLKRPWRLNGERHAKDGKRTSSPSSEGQKVVEIVEIVLPCFTNYWLEGIVEGNLCSSHNPWTVPSKITQQVVTKP